MKKAYLFIAFTSLLTGIVACTKKKTDTPADNSITNYKIMQIASKRGNLVTQFRMVYNSDNSVDSIIKTDGYSNDTRKFVYSGGKCVMTAYTDNSAWLVALIDLNADGMITKLESNGDTSVMQYNGTELTSLQHFVSGSAPTTNHYHWVNGNLDTTTQGSTWLSACEYDTSLTPLFYPNEIQFFTYYGTNLLKTKHLFKNITSNDHGGLTAKFTYNYYYNFDSKGRVSQMGELFSLGGTPDTTFYTFSY